MFVHIILWWHEPPFLPYKFTGVLNIWQIINQNVTGIFSVLPEIKAIEKANLPIHAAGMLADFVSNVLIAVVYSFLFTHSYHSSFQLQWFPVANLIKNIKQLRLLIIFDVDTVNYPGKIINSIILLFLQNFNSHCWEKSNWKWRTTKSKINNQGSVQLPPYKKLAAFESP